MYDPLIIYIITTMGYNIIKLIPRTVYQMCKLNKRKNKNIYPINVKSRRLIRRVSLLIQ